MMNGVAQSSNPMPSRETISSPHQEFNNINMLASSFLRPTNYQIVPSLKEHVQIREAFPNISDSVSCTIGCK